MEIWESLVNFHAIVAKYFVLLLIIFRIIQIFY